MKMAVTVLVTILLTVIAAYFSLSAQAVSRNEMVNYVANNSPYEHDKKAIAVSLENIQRSVNTNQDNLVYVNGYMRSILTQIALLSNDVASLTKKVDALSPP